MPLSEPQPRDRIHTRTIVINGYRRADGLYDIEAQLADTKARDYHSDYRGTIPIGEPLHGMWMRMTVDDALRIVACEAASDHTPYAVCQLAAPNFARLVGLRIKGGFLREAGGRIGGVEGCTHLRELLQQMGTTAHQTVHSARADREAERIAAETGRKLTPEEVETRTSAKFGGEQRIVNTCIAFDDTGPLVKRRWPELYRGGDDAAAEAPAAAAD
jgi:hypothetical protein